MRKSLVVIVALVVAAVLFPTMVAAQVPLVGVAANDTDVWVANENLSCDVLNSFLPFAPCASISGFQPFPGSRLVIVNAYWKNFSRPAVVDIRPPDWKNNPSRYFFSFNPAGNSNTTIGFTADLAGAYEVRLLQVAKDGTWQEVATITFTQ